MFELTEQQKEDKKKFLSSFEDSWYSEKLKKFDYDRYINTCEHTVARDKNMLMYNPEIYYYIDFIIQKKPDVIYDIGCGNNFFKELFKNDIKIFGIDPLHKNADNVVDFFKFFKNNAKVDFAFAINSIHSGNFKLNLNSFISFINKGGMGLITFNSVIINKDKKKSSYELKSYIELKIKNVIDTLNDKINFLLLEITDLEKDESLNGNVRIIFEKKQ